MKHIVRALLLASLITTGLALGPTASAGEAKGKMEHKGAGVTLKFAYLVKGPDAVEPNKIIRKLILSATDLGAKIQACTTMNCADSDLGEGMTIEFDAGPRLNYWMVRNGQRIQYSGTARPAVFTAKTDDATHLAGKFSFDDAGAGGPKLDVEFDATLLKEFKAAR